VVPYHVADGRTPQGLRKAARGLARVRAHFLVIGFAGVRGVRSLVAVAAGKPNLLPKEESRTALAFEGLWRVVVLNDPFFF